MKLEFMGYDGQYPQLCSGHLKFRANGKTFERYVWLLSGGRSYFDLIGTLKRVRGKISQDLYFKIIQSFWSTKPSSSK